MKPIKKLIIGHYVTKTNCLITRVLSLYVISCALIVSFCTKTDIYAILKPLFFSSFGSRIFVLPKLVQTLPYNPETSTK